MADVMEQCCQAQPLDLAIIVQFVIPTEYINDVTR
jgi:hypothetical protein